jgi:hypothetical protein
MHAKLHTLSEMSNPVRFHALPDEIPYPNRGKFSANPYEYNTNPQL